MKWEPRVFQALEKIAKAQPYPLLFATLSGAHLYGFPSPDSDYDLRGSHLLPLQNVLGLEVCDETVEDSRWIDGLEMDIVSHDLRKFIGMLLKPNGYVLEQLLSPWILSTSPAHQAIVEWCTSRNPEEGILTRNHAHHYLGFARSQWRILQNENPVRVKTLLYLYRVLLTGIHLMRTGQVEANLMILNEDFRLPFIDRLVECKKAGEHSHMESSDPALDESIYLSLVSALETARDESLLPECPGKRVRPALEEILVNARLSTFGETPST